jgi:23S rRNA pseudouridine1911/1915/1917 synthase
VQRVAAPGTPRSYEAIGHYRTLERYAAASMIEVRLVTGKRHQIRVQAWLAGCPLIGERIYTGPPAPLPEIAIPFERQALHGARLGFLHPRTGARLVFDLPLPSDLQALVGQLRSDRD